jgi:hypothetical protein
VGSRRRRRCRREVHQPPASSPPVQLVHDRNYRVRAATGLRFCHNGIIPEFSNGRPRCGGLLAHLRDTHLRDNNNL